MRQYIETLAESGRGSPSIADIDHSALLDRLLHGEKLLPIPAPTFMSYPCYELGDGESVVVAFVYDYTQKPGMVVINQNGDFEKLDNCTVRYTITGEVFRFDKPFPDGKPWAYDHRKVPWDRNSDEPVPDEVYLHLKKVPLNVKRVMYTGKNSYCTGKEYEVIGVGGNYWKIIDPERTGLNEDKSTRVQMSRCLIIEAEENNGNRIPRLSLPKVQKT